NLKTAAGAPFGLDAGGKFPEEIADGREHAFLLNADGGITESRCKFQRIDSVVVHDAVQIDVADVTFRSELGFHLEKRAIEEEIGLAPKHGGAHFAGGRTDFSGKKFFVFEINVNRRHEF